MAGGIHYSAGVSKLYFRYAAMNAGKSTALLQAAYDDFLARRGAPDTASRWVALRIPSPFAPTPAIHETREARTASP